MRLCLDGQHPMLEFFSLSSPLVEAGTLHAVASAAIASEGARPCIHTTVGLCVRYSCMLRLISPS